MHSMLLTPAFPHEAEDGLSEATLSRALRLRRELHAQPELAYEEHRTAAVVAAWLRACGLAVHTGIAGTGVVGVLTRGRSGRSVAFRADMDALPIQERSGAAHTSTRPGVMHACGHDGHVAMLLGAAERLASEGGFDGRLVFIFQPAEEGGRGAQAMIDDGLFERFPVDSVHALHNWPALPLGQFAVRSGPIMGSSLRFRIEVHGRGTHAATPHLGIDPVPPLCAIVLALQAVVARECHTDSSLALSVTRLGAGEAVNAVPASAWLEGTARFGDPAVQAQVEAALHRVPQGIAEAHGAAAFVQVRAGYPATVNTPEETARCAAVMQSLVGADRVAQDLQTVLTTEDFGHMLAVKPGCYALLGTGPAGGEQEPPAPGLHSPAYDFNDQVLPLGVAYWCALARALLPPCGADAAPQENPA